MILQPKGGLPVEGERERLSCLKKKKSSHLVKPFTGVKGPVITQDSSDLVRTIRELGMITSPKSSRSGKISSNGMTQVVETSVRYQPDGQYPILCKGKINSVNLTPKDKEVSFRELPVCP